MQATVTEMKRIPSDDWQRLALDKDVQPRIPFWRRRNVRFAAFYTGYILFLIAFAVFIIYVMASIPENAKAWHVGDYESAPNPFDTWEYAP